jgi:glutathione S-transferase
MELYFTRMSGNSSRVVFALRESGIEWTPRLLDRDAGETRSPDYAKINPMGKVPALVDGDFVLWESNAINWYIAQKRPQAGLWPTAIEQQAGVHRWLHFQSGHVTPACIPIFRHSNERMRKFWNAPLDAAAAEAGKKELQRYLPVLEGALSGKQWLEGTFSLADIAYASHLWLVREGGFDFSGYPNVSAWLERLWSRPAWRDTAAQVFG